MSAGEQADAIRVLYSDHHRWLHDWLRRKLGCAHNAADLAHDTFIRVITLRRTSLGEEPRAFLTHIAKGLVIDHWRRQEIERAYLETIAQLPEPKAPSPETCLLILEALYRIEAMLEGMPLRTREIFLLAQLDGLTYKEIAAQLDMTLITVKRHMRKAFLSCLTAA